MLKRHIIFYSFAMIVLLLSCKKLDIDPSDQDKVWNVDSYEIKTVDQTTGKLNISSPIIWETLKIRNFKDTDYKFNGTNTLVSGKYSGTFLEFESKKDLANKSTKFIFVLGEALNYVPVEKINNKGATYEYKGFEMQYYSDNTINANYNRVASILIRKLDKNKMRIILQYQHSNFWGTIAGYGNSKNMEVTFELTEK